MSLIGEPAFRVWGWDDMSERGRAAYVHNMAFCYLRGRSEAVPDDIVSGRLSSLRDWLEETRTLSHPAPSAGTTYIELERLPPEACLSADDLALIDRGIAPGWRALGTARQRLLLLRMAIAYVLAEYGGTVPEGLARWAVDASARCGND